MSNHVTNLCRRVAVSPTQKAVLMCLADRADDDGRAWPSIPWICEWTCLSRTAVIQALKALEAAGLLQVTRSSGKGNRLALDLGAIDQCASRTSAPAAPVRETDPTSAPAERVPVRHAHGTSAPAAPDTSVHQKDTKETPAKRQRNAPTRRIPADWQPDEALQAWAREKRPDLDLPAVVEGFRNHYLANGLARASWPASFRIWVTKEHAPPAKPSRHSGFAGKNYREGVAHDGSFR